MSKIWEPLDMLVYINWVDTLIAEAQDEMTDWETSFVASIEERLKIHRRNLTEHQARALENIYAAKTK